MKSDSDGSKDKQDVAQAIGIRGSLDGTSSGAVGISHFTEFNDTANSIDKNKGLRFDDLQPNSLTFKYNVRSARKSTITGLNEAASNKLFGNTYNSATFYTNGGRPNNEFTDKWDINDINIIDDIAFVSSDKYTDIHRVDISLSDAKCHQYFFIIVVVQRLWVTIW